MLLGLGEHSDQRMEPYKLTLASSFGLIWTSRPQICDPFGLLTTITLPAHPKNVRHASLTFVAADFSSAADIVATITSKGAVHLLHIKQ